MQISKGVEWAAHAASLMCGLPPDKGLRAEALARYHDVPGAYMAKQMQALSKAGIVQSARGKHGGYRLAKPADEITLWDIFAAIEGRTPAFTCAGMVSRISASPTSAEGISMSASPTRS